MQLLCLIHRESSSFVKKILILSPLCFLKSVFLKQERWSAFRPRCHAQVMWEKLARNKFCLEEGHIFNYDGMVTHFGRSAFSRAAWNLIHCFWKHDGSGPHCVVLASLAILSSHNPPPPIWKLLPYTPQGAAYIFVTVVLSVYTCLWVCRNHPPLNMISG